MPAVSIVVPVYNGEQWMSKCIDSILAQTETDIEVLLVDDASTDGSLALAKHYAKKDSRIRVIVKKNGGPHSARKAGTKAAAAKYVMYVDADDWIEPDMVKTLVRNIKETDSRCVILGYTEETDKGETKISQGIASGVYEGERLEKEVFAGMLCPGESFAQNIAPALWAKLFETEAMSRVMDRVDEDIWIGEDLACTFRYLLESDRITIDNGKNGYHYLIRENTITTKYDPLYFDKAKRLGDCLERTVTETDHPELEPNIRLYELFLLYRQIGTALKATDPTTFNTCLRAMESAAATPYYQTLAARIPWKILSIPPIDRLLLRTLLGGHTKIFECLIRIIYTRYL